MELKDIIRLKEGTQIRSTLDCGEDTGEWYTGTIYSNPSLEPGGDSIQVLIDRGSPNAWFTYVTERNKHLFKLLNKEWDDENNET